MTIVRKDTFTRANVSSGWGTATDGNTWTSQAGSGGYNVTSNEGILTGASSASYFNSLGSALSSADANALVRFSPTTGTGNDTAGIFLRFANTNNWYLARWSASAGQIQFLKKVSGTTTTVGTYTISVAVGAKWWMRFQVQGSTISIRTWLDGNSEPGTWNYTVTDTGISAAGLAGLYGFGGASGQNIQFDNFSVDDLATTINLTATLAGAGALSGRLTITRRLAGTLVSGGNLSGTLTTSLQLKGTLAGAGAISASGGHLSITRPLHGTLAGGGAVSGTLTVSPAAGGTGIGPIIRSTHSATWTGVGGSPGASVDIYYEDSTNSGWMVYGVATYGGAFITGRYQIDNNNGPSNGGTGTAVDESSTNTSSPGGWTHEFTNHGGVFFGSEDYTYTPNELAPVGTNFRYYVQASKTSPDSNGFEWNVFSCIYPGDPGLIVDTIQCINPGGTAISLAGADGMEIALIGSLEKVDANWLPANGGYGTFAGGNTAGWPGDGVGGGAVSVQPDYVYITPALTGRHLGEVASLYEDVTALTPAWTSPQLVALYNSSRLKLKVMGTVSSFPAGTTHTLHVLRALRRNLTSGDAKAIAADWKNPGTPTASNGTYTTFALAERAYTFASAASGHDLTATLDMSPSNVTVRFKPVVKITGWTDSAQPRVTWGGAQLVAGSDFRWTYDASNHILYLQLYFDVVASGAVTGQRNNAALAVASSANVLVGSVPSGGNVQASGLRITRPLVGAVQTAGALHANLTHTNALRGTLAGSGGVGAKGLAVTRPLAGIITGIGATGVPGIESLSNIVTTALRATIAGQGAIHGTLTALPGNIQLSGTLAGSGAVRASGLAITRPLAGTLVGHGNLSGSLVLGSASTTTSVTLTDASAYTVTVTDASAYSVAVTDAVGELVGV